MRVQITIRGVSEHVRDELSARAASRGQSMEEYLGIELERIASRPSPDAWLQGVRGRNKAGALQVSPFGILHARDIDRT